MPHIISCLPPWLIAWGSYQLVLLSSKTTTTTYIKATEREAYLYVAFANVVTATLTAAAVGFFILGGFNFQSPFLF